MLGFRVSPQSSNYYPHKTKKVERSLCEVEASTEIMFIQAKESWNHKRLGGQGRASPEPLEETLPS